MISYRCMYVCALRYACSNMSASCIERNKSSTGNNSNENSNKITNKKQKTPFAKSRNLFKNIMCTVVFVVIVVVFFSPELYCAQFYCIFPSLLLLFSLVFLYVHIFILSTSLEFQFTLCCCFAVSCLHSAALSRRALPLPTLSLTLLSLTSHRYDMLSYTYTLLFLACERVLLICHSLNATTDALSLSLSRSLVFILSAFPHILYYFATCGKSTSRLVAHFAFDASVAISALFFAHQPPPHICICLHLCVCVHILFLFCVGVLRLPLVVCSTCDSRFYFLSIAAASTRRHPPDELVC